MSEILTGDCVELMATLEAESVDAVVTDPPYGLGFMGKAWDSPEGNGSWTQAGGPLGIDHKLTTDRSGSMKAGKYDRSTAASVAYQAWCTTWAREAFRVAKPGAHLLAFGGTRTYHRLASAIEDAGFEIRDCLVWAYASGFPKSLDVSKAIDKAAGAEREVVGFTDPTDPMQSGRGGGSGFDSRISGVDERTVAITAPATADAQRWQGWGTALKPAWEPIVMARKPLTGTVAANVLKWGTGAINVDATRIAAEPYSYPTGPKGNVDPTSLALGRIETPVDSHPAGRWPANLILTDPIFDGGVDGVVGGGEVQSSPFPPHNGEPQVTPFSAGTHPGYGDTGTYSRFFLVAKSSRSDREPVLRDYALALHRERGDCDKLGAWGSEARKQPDPTASTSPARAISEAPETGISSSVTSPPGRPSTDPSPSAIRSTTSTATSRTTDSPTSSSSIPRPTSASTPAASSEMGNGGSPAESAANSRLWEPPPGTFPEKDGPSTDGADPATSASWSRRNVCADCGKPLPRFSTHPTQKPTELMRHLVRLVTPPGGTVLDCFLGSGTTAIACEMEGFAWIGMEKEPEYVAIAEARLNGTQRGIGL